MISHLQPVLSFQTVQVAWPHLPATKPHDSLSGLDNGQQLAHFQNAKRRVFPHESSLRREDNTASRLQVLISHRFPPGACGHGVTVREGREPLNLHHGQRAQEQRPWGAFRTQPCAAITKPEKAYGWNLLQMIF